MKPLKPDDLLIRTTPVEEGRWNESTDSQGRPASPIRLERFQELEQVLRNNPVQSEPYIELARIYLHQQRWVDAKRVLDRAADQFSKEEEVLHLREECLLARSLQLLAAAEAEAQRVSSDTNLKEVERAKLDLNALREKVCRARLQRHPDRLELTIPLAEALEGLDRGEEAREYLDKAVSDPDLRAAASLKQGEIHQRAGRVIDALSSYRRAALFREPPPTPAIKLAALSRAAQLAFDNRILDSASRYVAMLREMEPNNSRWSQMADDIQALEEALQP